MGDESSARDLTGLARDLAAVGGEEGGRVPVGGLRPGGSTLIRRDGERSDAEEVEAGGETERQTNFTDSR